MTALIPAAAATEPVLVDYSVRNSWNDGFTADVVISNPGPDTVNGWVLSFDLPVTITKVWSAVEGPSTPTMKIFSNGTYTAVIGPGETEDFGFNADGDSTLVPQNIVFTPVTSNPGGGGGEEPGDEPSEHGKPQTGPFNLAEALQKTLWFYDAQRSGGLPPDFRIPWRGDSALNDGSDASMDLSGGFYDAGDHIKFNLPMAFSATLLAWGAIEYSDAYAETGQTAALLDLLQWSADYFRKCHIRNPDGSTAAFCGQVGDPALDHATWGPAETMAMERPSFFIDPQHPGSDLAAETAAALAAASILFMPTDPVYADSLMDHAEALYTFADAHRGHYSDAITNARPFYPSSGYHDELVWGALWLHRATGDPAYLQKAQVEYAALGARPFTWGLSWDDKIYGCYILLACLDPAPAYRTDAERWLDHWADETNGVYRTPGGLAWLDAWGSLRYAANAAFCAQVYADRIDDPGGRYSAFATNQLNYILGDNPAQRSYVCGYGTNAPINPHHRNAHASPSGSIQTPPLNTYTLYGALVGGPDANDDHVDARTNYTGNETALDYNAGLCGVLAGLYADYGGYALRTIGAPALPDTLLRETVDAFPAGLQTDAEWKTLWPGTKWANGPDEGRVAVDDSLDVWSNGKSIRIFYPEGSQTSSECGAQWFIDLNGEYEDLYMSYWVRFNPGFDFILGGKLPGLGGAVSFDDRTHEWSGRLMWRENGKAEFYIHVPSDNTYDPGDRFWWSTEGFQATFVPGNWHHIELHLALNTPGQFDGVMEGWFDGVKAASYTNFYFRDAPTADARIAWGFFSTFFGGSSSDIWEATRDEYAWFDELIVSTNRIGYPGAPPDLDGDLLPDEWETEAFGSTLPDGATDSDNDGQNNLSERVGGTDPMNPVDRTAAQLAGEAIRFDGQAGRLYKLMHKETLSATNWTEAAAIGPLREDRPVEFIQPQTDPKGFYRIEIENP